MAYRILIIGHSYVRRAQQVCGAAGLVPNLWRNLNLQPEKHVVKFVGSWWANNFSYIHHIRGAILSVMQLYPHADVVILDIGSNDLVVSDKSPEELALNLFLLAMLIHQLGRA